MASTILYKFRSEPSFVPLPLPGTSARLFDIKRAIVRAKKLDASSSNTSLEFDLAIQNASTNEVYDDESMILPRGTRVVVRRVAAERGRGILSRMAAGAGAAAGPMAPGGTMPGGSGYHAAANSGFYTIRSRDREADDEFLDAAPPPPPQAVTAAAAVVDESKELEALRAVTDQAGSMYGAAGGMIPGGGGHRGNPRDPRVAGQGAPPHFAKPPPMMNSMNNRNNRPNADPELRQQELASAPHPKKRATGIPRTFLNLSGPSSAPPTAAGEGDAEEGGGGEDGGNLAAQLQPSAQAFQALVRTGGGQSLASASKRRDLDYALKLTATSIPEHLQCGICHGIVKNAMLVPWDTEGRPTCESCIRDGLTKNGFTCPLTGTEGVSPDDLFPNVGLRKAAEAFVAGVMEKMDSIERQIEAEEEEEARKRAAAEEQARNQKNSHEFEDGGDGIVTGKKSKINKKKGAADEDDLLFGGDDEFGGDVFDVAGDEPEEPEEDDNAIIEPKKLSSLDDNTKKDNESKDHTSTAAEHGNSNGNSTKVVDSDGNLLQKSNNESNVRSNNETAPALNDATLEKKSSMGSDGSSPPKTADGADKAAAAAQRQAAARKEAMKRRGPPAGYVLGPAGSGGMGPGRPNGHNSPMGLPPQQQAVPPPPPPMMMGGGPPGGLPGGPQGGHPPLGRGGPPPYGDMGRGGGRGGPHGGHGGRFYPNQFGGRGGGGGGGRGYPNQQHYPSGGRGGPPPMQQQQGGYPPNQGGRGGFHRNQQWGDDNGNDWNRNKRPRDMMEQGSSPANMYQGEPKQHHQGGYQGRGGPPGGYQGRGGGGGYNPQFQGGRGGGGGRFQG
eukprot:CAMPEP_0183712112 /NCGR_PEP_ID=MMETSP0737-20130205/7351_1 /TAXON_ID=385413 /ORGANISM="Thalassiosira miniscula, Strain CCMP1093" /LENGTH=836 /DNA_ID=CAMNT_0025940691 /DNA_START=89 /DNA_END=2595 /DNA_ORIENTATION=+